MANSKSGPKPAYKINKKPKKQTKRVPVSKNTKKCT